MAVRCLHCSREFDITVFAFGRTITCPCGTEVRLQHGEREDRVIERRREEKNLNKIKREADRISSLIVGTDYPDIDIEIEIINFKDKIGDLFPDRLHLFDLIYNPEKTLFLKRAERQGAQTLNGLSMLKEQAMKSWKIWNES